MYVYYYHVIIIFGCKVSDLRKKKIVKLICDQGVQDLSHNVQKYF